MAHKQATVTSVAQQLAQAAKLPTILSASAIAAFFSGEQAAKDQAEVGKIESSRMSYLRGLMFEKQADGSYRPLVDVEGVKSATSDYVKAERERVGWKGGKGAGKRPPAVKTALNRSGDIRNLYGAVRFAGLNPEGKGYKVACDEAIAALSDKGIGWDGVAKPTDAERKAQKIASEARARAAAVVDAAGEKAAELGRPLTDEEMQDLAGQATELHDAKTAWQAAVIIVARKGDSFAEQVAAVMPQAIGAVNALKAQHGDSFASLTAKKLQEAAAKLRQGNGQQEEQK